MYVRTILRSRIFSSFIRRLRSFRCVYVVACSLDPSFHSHSLRYRVSLFHSFVVASSYQRHSCDAVFRSRGCAFLLAIVGFDRTRAGVCARLKSGLARRVSVILRYEPSKRYGGIWRSLGVSGTLWSSRGGLLA